MSLTATPKLIRRIALIHKSRSGIERRVTLTGHAERLDAAAAYLGAIAPMHLSERTIIHLVKTTGSFSCSSFDRGLLTLRTELSAA